MGKGTQTSLASINPQTDQSQPATVHHQHWCFISLGVSSPLPSAWLCRRSSHELTSLVRGCAARAMQRGTVIVVLMSGEAAEVQVSDERLGQV